MANALSLDLWHRVVAVVEAGASRRQAERFGVGVSYAIRWVALARATGELEPHRRARRSHLGVDRADPDLTLAEIAERLGEAVGYRPPPSVVHDFFKRGGGPGRRGSCSYVRP